MYTFVILLRKWPSPVEEDIVIGLDAGYINTFSNQMSMAIANLFMMKRTEREKLKLQFVNSIVQSLVTSVDPDQIYKALLGKVTAGLRATVGVLAFADGSGTYSRYRH